jgi:hypothetical protein
MTNFIDTLVRVRFLSVKAAIVFNVLKSLGWKASIASEIVVWTSTVHKLLFRERDGLPSGLSICCLKCTSSAARISTISEKSHYFNCSFMTISMQEITKC